MPPDARRTLLTLLAELAARLRADNDATERENCEMEAEQDRQHAGHALPPRPRGERRKGKVRT